MRERMILLRFLAVPLRHKLVAAGIAVAVGIGFFAWAHHDAAQSATTAVLSFDADAAWETVPRIMSAHEKEPAVALAQSILSDEAVKGLEKQVSVNSDAVKFRSRLELKQPSDKLLYVNYHDADKKLSAASANAVANLLVGWRASPFVAPAMPAPAAPQSAPLTTHAIAQPYRHRQPLHPRSDVLRRLAAQLAVTDQKLAAFNVGPPQASTARKPDASTPPSNTDNEQQRTLESQLGAAQKKLDDLRVRYTDEYPDVETAKENIAEIRQKLASIRPVSNEAGQAAQPQILDASGNEASQLRMERDRLTQAIAVEKRHEAMLQDQAASEVGDTPVAVQAASPSLPRTGTVRQPVNPVARQILHSPFALVQLAETDGASHGEDGLFALWYGVLAGIFSGLLYLGGAIWRHRLIEGAVALERLVLNYIPGAEETKRHMERSIHIENSWEEEIRKAISMTDLSHAEESLATGSQQQAYGGAAGLRGQLRYDEIAKAICEKIKREPNSWMAHTEGARVAIEMGDLDTAIREMNLAITVAPENLKAPLNKIITQLDGGVNTNK
jgi:hypothetical protein